MSACSGPFVNMKLIYELFPQFNPVSVSRWNRSDKSKPGRSLPKHDLALGGLYLWKLETVLSWADAQDIPVDWDAVHRVIDSQTC